MTVIKAEPELRAIPEVEGWKVEWGLSIFCSELVELAEGLVTVRELVKRKHPELFAVELGRQGGRAIARRGSEYFSKLQALRKQRKGGRPRRNGRG